MTENDSDINLTLLHNKPHQKFVGSDTLPPNYGVFLEKVKSLIQQTMKEKSPLNRLGKEMFVKFYMDQNSRPFMDVLRNDLLGFRIEYFKVYSDILCLVSWTFVEDN